MSHRKTKKAVYFLREVRELFERVHPYAALTIYILIAHISGKHRTIVREDQAAGALYHFMHEINTHNGTNRSSAIPVRENGRHELLEAGEKGGRFCGIRRIPPTPEGRSIFFAYRAGKLDEARKLLQTQFEMIECARHKGILTSGQVEKLIGPTINALEAYEAK